MLQAYQDFVACLPATRIQPTHQKPRLAGFIVLPGEK
jgi:hypothetical protein